MPINAAPPRTVLLVFFSAAYTHGLSRNYEVILIRVNCKNIKLWPLLKKRLFWPLTRAHIYVRQYSIFLPGYVTFCSISVVFSATGTYPAVLSWTMSAPGVKGAIDIKQFKDVVLEHFLQRRSANSSRRQDARRLQRISSIQDALPGRWRGT